MKRFSTKFFIIITLLHMLGTVLLIDAGFAALRAEKQTMNTGQPEPSFVWLSVWSWIRQPVSKLVQYYDQHHPHPVNRDEGLRGMLGSRKYFFVPYAAMFGLCRTLL